VIISHRLAQFLVWSGAAIFRDDFLNSSNPGLPVGLRRPSTMAGRLMRGRAARANALLARLPKASEGRLMQALASDPSSPTIFVEVGAASGVRRFGAGGCQLPHQYSETPHRAVGSRLKLLGTQTPRFFFFRIRVRAASESSGEVNAHRSGPCRSRPLGKASEEIEEG